MNFSPLADPFVQMMQKKPLPKINNVNVIEQRILISLYEDMYEADKHILADKSPILADKSPMIADKSPILADKPILALPNNNKFFPKTIRKYIQKTPFSLLTFTSKINNREIKINFYIFVDAPIATQHFPDYVKMMLTWLTICNKYAPKKCAEKMCVTIYLTPFEKILPPNNTAVLSPEHINTAFTMSCVADGEITIYRAEEWFKVFIHETFHAYGLDFGLNDATALRTLLAKTFPIKSDLNASEAYTETWARIINCLLYSFYSLPNKQDRETFLLYSDFCLQLERLFTIFQMNKVLEFMGLTYEDLHDSREKSVFLRKQLYKENTHVFAYYVLPAIFLNDYKHFITWCSVNNSVSFLKFDCQEANFKKMANYIEAVYKNPTLLKTLTDVAKVTVSKKQHQLDNTTRMAVIDMINIYL